MAEPTLDRRTLLASLAGAGAASVAGCSILDGGEDGDASEVGSDRAEELATRFAPTLYFDENEPWFPTDPRPYTSERDGETIVDGFDAFDGYHERFTDGQPPNPTVFYHAVEYEDSPLAVVQFWFYSAFDQFTTNFHWHDWEVLHVFVDSEGQHPSDSRTQSDDTETDEPQLYVASSHSRKVPNNEYLDPDPEGVPRILSELGSHSSALSVNDSFDEFQRLPEGTSFADITNSAIETLEDVAAIPFAYGLPRDEGYRLPYVVPEYEGAPLYEHPDLPAVERSDLVSEGLTVRSLDALTSPPTDLPDRTTGLVFQHAGREDGDEADVEYDLVPTAEIEDITDFTGPQLSFEFAVPEFGEDAVAGHITTTGVPWGQPRYENPAADITEPNHRAALAERYDAIGEAAAINTVVASVSEAVPSDDAPEDEGLTTQESTVEAFVLLESDPEAVPTFNGVAAVRDVPAGEHRLTVNRAGAAPHSEPVSVADDDGPTLAGVDGEIPTVANERARKVELDPAEADSDLTALAVADDFAGRLYDAPLDGAEAVYVHDGGAYTTEVRDADDAVGAFRVNPDPAAEAAVRIENPNTGKASLATFLADISAETQSAIEGGREREERTETDRTSAITGLSQALGAVAEAARRAAERAEAGDAANADKRLRGVRTALAQVRERLEEARAHLPPELSTATEKRLDQADRRAEQALGLEKL